MVSPTLNGHSLNRSDPQRSARNHHGNERRDRGWGHTRPNCTGEPNGNHLSFWQHGMLSQRE